MSKEELTKGMTYLGVAYGKEYSTIELETYYDFLKGYSNDVFKKSIKNIIRTEKFVPKIADLVQECENNKNNTRNDILEFMKLKGYFRNNDDEFPKEKELENYSKAIEFVTRGEIPSWLKEDMVYYSKIMNQQMLGNEQKALL